MYPVHITRVVFLVLALVMGLVAAPAVAAPYAAIVMDARNGKVLHARSADRRLHPASLTKMMTLYLTFEAVREGRLKLDQRVRVSRHAARQPASKLYLRAGQRVTIRSLIRATAIKSANDAAMVLAEAVGGSQRSFARMMTAKARQLGMRNSVFKNPHGLTQQGHYSTARDMALLGRRLFFDFPKYYNIFQRRSDYAAGKRIWTTNRLLSSYRGADGIKTGYTRAAGYNLVASAQRGEERIIAVIFGGRSSGSRNRKMAELLDLGFKRAPRHARVIKPHNPRVAVGSAPIPMAKPGSRPSALASLAAAVSPKAEAALPLISRRVSSRAPGSSVVPRPKPGNETKVAALASDIPVPRAKPRRVAVAQTAKRRPDAPASDSWAIQVGAYRSESRALAGLVTLGLDTLPVLEEADIGVTKGEGRSGSTYYRIRATGLTAGKSRRACRDLKALGHACARIAPGSW